ncbi:MAG: hypothetical protein AAB421_05390 [Patescibacteria group bacterium]
MSRQIKMKKKASNQMIGIEAPVVKRRGGSWEGKTYQQIASEIAAQPHNRSDPHVYSRVICHLKAGITSPNDYTS